MSKRRTTPDVHDAYVVYLHDRPKYVGITIRGVAIRWAEHQKTKSQNTALANAMRKHGVGAFTVEHVASARNADDLAELERILIEQHGTMSPRGYNLKEGGVQNFKFSEETRLRMRARQLGVKPSAETLAKIRASSTGRKSPHSDEARAKMSEARQGKSQGPMSEQRKANISAAKKGKPGRPVSEEARRKIATSQLGKRGYKHTAASLQKMADARRGKTNPPEVIAKMRAAALRRWHGEPKQLELLSGYAGQ